MTSCVFTVLGRPQSWHRARSRAGRYFTDTKSTNNRKHIAASFLAARPPSWPLGARYRVELHAYPETRGRQDIDRIVNAVFDALNCVAYDDDSQIDELLVVRHPVGEEPRIEVRITALAAAP